MKIETYNCWGCEKDLIDYNPQMCCSGRECGCIGLPTNPPFCNPECYSIYKLKQALEANNATL